MGAIKTERLRANLDRGIADLLWTIIGIRAS
jgi:hypothetical protein